MARLKAAKRSDEDNLKLFPELPDPPPIADIVELKNLRHPVWTENKAKLISRYLQLFTYVTKHGTYIDGFSGRQSKNAVEGWAAELVLGLAPRRLRRFYLCDNDPDQVRLLRNLVAAQPPKGKNDPNRTIEVVHGDFNIVVSDILKTKKLDPATFCLLDQRTFECKWRTVEALASHRPEKPKIELFYFLPIGWLDRALFATTKNVAEVEAWWGRPDWRSLLDMKPHEKALAFVSRFRELGYDYVYPFPILDANDRIMFYMILASDHSEAPRLMYRAYDQAVRDIPGWKQLALLDGGVVDVGSENQQR